MHYIEKFTWRMEPSKGGSVLLWGMTNSSCYAHSFYAIVRGLGRNGIGQHSDTMWVSICALRKRSDLIIPAIAVTLKII